MGSAIYDPEQRSTWLDRAFHQRSVHTRSFLSMQLDGLVQTHERAREWMLEESKKVQIVQLIETAPGIAEIRAPLIVAIVDLTAPLSHSAPVLQLLRLGCCHALFGGLDEGSRRQVDPQRCPPDLGTQSQPTSAAQECFQGRCRGCRQSHAATSAKACLLSRDRFGNQTQPRAASRWRVAYAGAVLAMWKNIEKCGPTRQH